MGLFRRTRRGKHALGAAVTGIPSVPVVVPGAAVAPLPPWELAAPAVAPAPVVVTPVAPEVASEIAQLIATGEAWGDTATGAAGAVAASSAGDVGAPEAPGVIAPTVAPTGLAASPVSAPETAHAPMGSMLPAGALHAAPATVGAEFAAVDRSKPVPTIGAPAVVAASPADAAIATVASPPVVAVQPFTAWSDPAPAVAAAPPARVQPAEAAPAIDAVTVPEQAAGGAREVLEAALAELTVLRATGAPTASPEVAAPHRVQLGFRDGTSTTLDPSSTQARALEELAQSLTRRD